jgi:streptogramin lyase
LTSRTHGVSFAPDLVKLALLIAVALALAVASPAAAITPTITEFHTGLNAGNTLFEIAGGPDGNSWFTDTGTTKAIGRITPAGAINEFTLGGASSADAITSGPDGNIWFADSGAAAIGRITPAGAVDEFSAGLNLGSVPSGITSGPDGNVWFTDVGTTKAIGRITPAGAIHEFSTGLDASDSPYRIVTGADGNLWFTDNGTRRAIGRITPTGTITLFTVGLAPTSGPYGIAAGADGNVWFADNGTTGAVGRVTPAGAITEFTAGLNPGDFPYSITGGADGAVWFTVSTCPGAAIGRVTPAGTITRFTSGLNADACPYGIGSGPDGNIWFADESTAGAIGRVTTPPAVATGAATVLGAGSARIAGTVNGHAQPTTYRFDFGTTAAYGTNLAGDAGGGSTNAPVAVTLSGLSPATTYHYRLVGINGTDATAGADATFTTLALPRISGLRVSNKVWRAGKKLPKLAKRVPTGTRISFRLDRDAGVQLRFLISKPGRRVGSKCKAPTRRNRRARRCKRLVSTGKQIAFGGHAGANTLRFQGRISRSSRPLKPGSYQLKLVARDTTSPRASTASARFKIVK